MQKEVALNLASTDETTEIHLATWQIFAEKAFRDFYLLWTSQLLVYPL